MNFRKLDIDPARNPAVLDTATWDGPAAWEVVRKAGDRWLAVRQATGGSELPPVDGITCFAGSCVRNGEALLFLAGLPDQQQVFVRLGGSAENAPLGQPLGQMQLAGQVELAAYPAQAAVIDRFCRKFNPSNAPRALGRTPRLGIGVRMTTMVWPGIFDAMERGGFAANSIQNSVRELNLLDDLLNATPAPKNYACGFGTIESGYTGSSFEGLWVSGVLAALRYGKPLRYGADADHIQVKRADVGFAWARRVLEAARYYTFYTIDVSDVLNYGALQNDAMAETQFDEAMPDAKARRDLLTWHGGDTPTVRRFAAKYTVALDALATLRSHIEQFKEGQPFDLELSIDEHPAEVHAFDCLTSGDELLFVLRELKRRGLPTTHIAPNFGVEKGVDYRHPGGLSALHRRVETQHRQAEEFNVMLDVHSADDLGSAVREVLRKATGGCLHYKISPSLQLQFAEVLRDVHPDLFRRWWDDAMAYAGAEAAAGSAFAAQCLAAPGAAARSPAHPVFHHFSFAFVGRRDRQGRFLQRQEFYALSPEFCETYCRRVSDRLLRLAQELF